MNTYILFHHLLMVMFFLVLPRLPAVPTSVLVLGRVGYNPAEGLYACFTRMGGAPPDLALQYSATYTYGSSKTLATCTGDISQHPSLLDGSVVYCLPPCPGMEMIHPGRMSVVITGHDRVTRDIQAALMESFTLTNVTPTVIQPGEGVVEVQWAAQPGRTYRVQLWHYPQTLAKAAGATEELENIGVETEMEKIKRGATGRVECDGEVVEDAGGLLKASGKEVEESQQAVMEGLMEKTSQSEIKENLCGVMSNETLIRIKQCYHDLDKEDDDDDDDNDDDEDNEEDNDDFIKFMRWRKCVALYAPCTTITSTSTPAVLNTSGPLNCMAGLCVYYFMNVPASGSISVEVTDMTDAVVSSSHTLPTPVQKWGSLIIDTVVVSSEGVDANPRPKTMIIKLSNRSQENKEGSRETGQVKGEEEVALEAESLKEDYEAVIINGHNHSEVLKNQPAECDPQEGVCSVSGLQTLVDPKEQGAVSDMFLLLSDRHTGISSLVSITDVHVRVYKVAAGTVVIMWDREPSIQEFIVRVVHDNGESSETITVVCSKRGTDCLATFSSLARGYYSAEVSYTKKTNVVLSSQFFMEDNTVTE